MKGGNRERWFVTNIRFSGSVKFQNGAVFEGREIDLWISANGSVEGVVNADLSFLPEATSGRIFGISGTARDGTRITLKDVRTAGLSTVGDRSLLKFRARSLHENLTPDAKHNQPDSIRYDLANLAFTGIEITVRETAHSVSHKLDKFTFAVPGYSCELQQCDDYDAIVRKLKDTGGSAVTSTLTIRGFPGQALRETEIDDFVDAVCELLSLASKNTVRWTRRTTLDSNKNKVLRLTRAVRLSSFQDGWSLVPDLVGLSPSVPPRCELAYFLGSVLPVYLQTLRTQGLRVAIEWILESEHQGSIELRYMSAFLAIEKLRSKFLNRADVPVTIAADWKERIAGGLGGRLIGVVEESVGPLTDQQRQILISKMGSANAAPIPVELDALCRQLGVRGFEKDMSELRNRLVHTGDYGDFKSPESVRLLKNLSHIVDVCVLKLLKFDGFYHHWATGWKLTNVKEHAQS
jgi:hypothetical protein